MTNLWNFGNSTYFGFNQQISFIITPNQGVPYDNSLVSYWRMDEGNGTILDDSIGNGDNGTITNASWTTGKYGNALAFQGNNGSGVALTNLPLCLNALFSFILV